MLSNCKPAKKDYNLKDCQFIIDKKDYISIIIKETFFSLKWCSSNTEHHFNYLESFSHLIGITIIFTSGDMFPRTQK